MKRTFCFLFLAAAAAVLLPLHAAAQAVPEPAPSTPTTYKYSVYGGFAYTSINQVNTSRYGLIGGKATVTRYWGKYFAVMASGDYYKPSVHSSTPANASTGTQATLGNPGDPSVYSFLAGPEIHANIYGPIDGLFFGELGFEHTGGEGMNPATSFAGGFGGGARWNLNNRWAIQATGDRVAASFSPINNTPQLAYSTHRTWNARATIGVLFHF